MNLAKADRETLLANPAFTRFLWDLIQTAGIFDPTTNGTDGRNLIAEGRRNLGLEILRSMDEAQPVQSPSGVPVLTLIQTLREAAQSTTSKEPKRDRSSTYGDIDGSDDD